MRLSFGALSALSLGATLAAGAIGLSWHHERDQADAVRELTEEVAALRSQLAARSASSAASGGCTDGSPGAAVSASVEAGSSAAANQVPAVVAAVPAAVPAPAAAPPPPLGMEPRVGDGGRAMTAQQEAALASATGLVDGALHRGAISRSAMATLRARIDAAGHSEESDALRAQIADAINQGLVIEERPTTAWH